MRKTILVAGGLLALLVALLPSLGAAQSDLTDGQVTKITHPQARSP